MKFGTFFDILEKVFNRKSEEISKLTKSSHFADFKNIRKRNNSTLKFNKNSEIF